MLYKKIKDFLIWTVIYNLLYINISEKQKSGQPSKKTFLTKKV